MICSYILFPDSVPAVPVDIFIKPNYLHVLLTILIFYNHLYGCFRQDEVVTII